MSDGPSDPDVSAGEAPDPEPTVGGGHDHGHHHGHHHHAGALPADDRAVPTEIAPGVVQLDTLLGGWAQVTAGYLITGTEPVLVETGSQTSVPALLAALEGLGVAADELAGIAVTHIHLDHAGGVGDVAAAFPRSEEHTSELQSLMRTSYAVFCLQKKT